MNFTKGKISWVVNNLITIKTGFEEVGQNMRLRDDIGFDSIEIMDFFVRMEEAFDTDVDLYGEYGLCCYNMTVDELIDDLTIVLND